MPIISRNFIRNIMKGKQDEQIKEVEPVKPIFNKKEGMTPTEYLSAYRPVYEYNKTNKSNQDKL
jgi:hypothetical protein